jgi:cation diffusion facilitator CzcD-associated flavoprotein CzcO
MEDLMLTTDLLIIGSGPYGLATAAYAQQRGMACRLQGRPMDLWWRHMPDGMFLRSGIDWHLDPSGVHTIEAYVRQIGIDPASVDPLPVGLFRDYGRWFQEAADLRPDARLVRTLTRMGDHFEAELEDGEWVRARRVLLALGFASSMNLPEDLVGMLPAGSYAHAWDLVDFARLAGQEVLIVGGRQSAYEWAALIAEHGAAAVHLAHRHQTPRFAPSDWSWVEGMLEASAAQPGWFRRLQSSEQAAIRQRFWTEGRLKLEPWLGPRISREEVHIWPGAAVTDADERPDGRLHVRMTTGAELSVDQVVLATGYDVDVRHLPLLDPTTILPLLATEDGFPVLDADFESSVPGLFFSGLAATRDFGPFFGFLAGCRVAPRRIVDRMLRDGAGSGEDPATVRGGQAAA